MSYSHRFQRPVQAGKVPTLAGLVVGQRIAKTSFLPSYETSGLATSPWPWVNCAVMLCSMALADDFSRMMRSPPSALGAPLVGLARIELTRFA